MAMEGSAADSYIGSLISLTSKSEIRYEGVLYNINTDDSTIGLRDVRSFGTEGRKKDGLQIPPSDRSYEYILFRGSDIKDLQVKSSPATQTFSALNSDPAIIQSQHPRTASASTSLPNATVSSTTVTSSEISQLGQPASNIQNSAPLYQPKVGNLGTWGPSLSSANGMPMYWQGYNASPSGQLSYQNQQPLMRPPGHSRPPLLQQQTNQYLPQHMPPLHLPTSLQQVSSSLQTQMSSSLQQQNTSSLQQLPSLLQHQLPSFQQHLPSMNQQMPSLLRQPLINYSLSAPNEKSTLPAPPSSFTSGYSSGPSVILTSTSSSTSTVPLNFPPTFPLLPVTSLGLDIATSSNTAKAPIAPPALADKTSVTSLSPAASLSSSELNGNSLFQTLSSKPITTTSPTSQQTASVPQAVLSNVGSGNPISIQTPAPALVTPGHLLKSSSISSVPASQAVHKDVEVVQVSSASAAEPSVSVEPEKKLSVLPLATPLRPLYKPKRVSTHSGYRGRGRGRGRMNSRPLMSFDEEFDFTAMNEKFKKDEVWGHLGKSSKLHGKQEGAKHVDEELSQYKDVDLDSLKPVYNKDDFFDSLSSNTQDHESNHGRHKFSEQRKLDTETFGEFSRYRGARGGRGPGRRNYRGSFNGRGHGRGYGYGSGRGRGGPNRVS